MAWTNPPLTLYHGTDDLAASSILTKISLAKGRGDPDFGQGFYTTTYLHQAQQWANQRVRQGIGTRAAVLTLSVDRTRLSHIAHLAFIADSADFYDLVAYSRLGGRKLHGCDPCYDVVYGPVSMWPQTLVIKDCDQISFHTQAAIAMLTVTSTMMGDPYFYGRDQDGDHRS